MIVNSLVARFLVWTGLYEYDVPLDSAEFAEFKCASDAVRTVTRYLAEAGVRIAFVPIILDLPQPCYWCHEQTQLLINRAGHDRQLCLRCWAAATEDLLVRIQRERGQEAGQ